MNWLPFEIDPEAASRGLFTFIAGTMLVALTSIVMPEKRTVAKLLAGMVFGGLGCLVAYVLIPDGPWWKLPVCGAVAVMTENTFLGLIKFSKEFAEDPWEKAERIWDKTPWSKS